MASIAWTIATTTKAYNNENNDNISLFESKLSQTAAFNSRKVFQIMEGAIVLAALAIGITSLIGLLPIGSIGSIACLTVGGLLLGDVMISVLLNLAFNRDERLFGRVRFAEGRGNTHSLDYKYTIDYKVLGVIKQKAYFIEPQTPSSPTLVTRMSKRACESNVANGTFEINFYG